MSSALNGLSLRFTARPQGATGPSAGPDGAPVSHDRRLDALIASLIKRSRPPSVVCRELAGLGVRPGQVHARIVRLMSAAGGLDPTDRACVVLWGRARASDTSPTGWRLDGRAATLPQIFRQANRVLNALGLDPIPYPQGGADPKGGR